MKAVCVQKTDIRHRGSAQKKTDIEIILTDNFKSCKSLSFENGLIELPSVFGYVKGIQQITYWVNDLVEISLEFKVCGYKCPLCCSGFMLLTLGS